MSMSGEAHDTISTSPPPTISEDVVMEIFSGLVDMESQQKILRAVLEKQKVTVGGGSYHKDLKQIQKILENSVEMDPPKAHGNGDFRNKEDQAGNPPRRGVDRGVSLGGSVSAPPPPSLRRNDIHQMRFFSRPGAVAIPGTNYDHHPVGSTMAGRGNQSPTQATEQQQHRNDSESIPAVLNAHLVEDEPERIEQGVTCATVTRTVQPSNTPAVPLVKAQPMSENDSQRNFRSRTMKMFLLLLVLVIAGLVIGVIVGFRGNQSGEVNNSNIYNDDEGDGGNDLSNDN